MSAADAAGESVDARALVAVRALFIESLDLLCLPLPADSRAEAGAAAEPRRRSAPRAGDGEVCVTENVALPPAEKLAGAGRWNDLALLYGERLGCGDPSYACLLRDHYRAEKDWASADRLRDELQEHGFEVRDTPQGTQVVPEAGRRDRG